jgi:hypothetical protein
MYLKAVKAAQNWLPGLRNTGACFHPRSRPRFGQRRELERLLRPGDIVIDVGAGNGLYALRAAELVGPTGRVLALEPDEEAFRRLTVNPELTVCPWARTFRAAAGDRDGAGDGTLTLDSLVARENLWRINLIRIGVAGVEPRVIAGAARLLCRLRPTVVFECAGYLNNAGVRASVDETLDLLAEANYRFFSPRDGLFGEIAAPPAEVCTVLAVHREETPPFER